MTKRTTTAFNTNPLTAPCLEQGAETSEDTETSDDTEMTDAPASLPSKDYPQSQWPSLSVAPSDKVTPHSPNPRYAANAVTLSLQADRATPDPLFTCYSVSTWPGTMLMFISRTLGPKKWPSYRNAAIALLSTDTSLPGRDNSAYNALIDLVSSHGIVGYLHNDLAHQLNGFYSEVFPILEGLQPAGGLKILANEQAAVVKRITLDWDREFWLDGKRMPRSRWRREGAVGG